MAKMINFSADMFNAARVFVSTEETRYYPNGVAIQPHPSRGVYLVATDNRRAGIFYDPLGYTPRNLILSTEAPVKSLKTVNGDTRGAPGAERRVFLDGEAGRIVRVAETDMESVEDPSKLPLAALEIFTEIDRTFPDWTRFVPREADSEAPPETFNAGYLADMKKAIDLLPLEYRERSAAMSIAPSGKHGPALIRPAACDRAVFVLMPIRGTRTETRTPDWLFPAAEATVTAA